MCGGGGGGVGIEREREREREMLINIEESLRSKNGQRLSNL